MTETTAPVAAHSSLLAAYERDPRHYHEMLDARGTVRPHWRRLLADLEASTPMQMRHRLDFVARQIREDGITYNIYADAKGADRPWELDLLPNIIGAAEWATLAAGISQRASLLNEVLGDLYGPQNLLREGLLPPELVFGHNNFLWPCHGIKPPGGTFLHIYAADLARAPDGSWWVVADRTQAPSGAGYALENRQIISRAFPELFRELKVQQLGSFFGELQATLRRCAPVAEGEAPLSVLLTSGRYNETYFEHVFLARHLGIPLVEGHDLTVRGNTAYLKTLGGLKRVHAILRRMDDDFCDPLELRSDSALGVPGLLEVARAGRVLIANALGSGVLESPGLLGFLPRICERLRGEPLAIPSVATWWCGEEPVREQALGQIERLVIKGAYPSQRFEAVFGDTLGHARLAELRARVRARPQAYVAQEIVQLSQAPIWQASSARARVTPRSIGIRVYAVATEHGYAVMPGGLTRLAGAPGAGIVSMQRGGGSKDTWVLADKHGDGEILQRREIGVRDLIRRDDFLPSRLIENLFWLGRYSERADNTTRLLRVVLARYVDSGSTNPSFNAAIDACRALGMLRGHSAIRRRLLAAVVDEEAPGSLPATLNRLFWSASQVRGRLSQENWRALMELQRETAGLRAETFDLGDALDILNRLLLTTSALSGFAHDDMTRDDGWRFLMIARRLERLQFLADVVARVLRHPAATDFSTLEWLLELADSIITYRARYLFAPQIIPTLDLVLCDPANPHSVLFQVQELRRDLAALGDEFGNLGAGPLEDIELRLRECDLSALEDSLLGARGRADAMNGLAELSSAAAEASRTVSDQLNLRYFAHVDDISQRTVSA
jgi:uncharacterized circularly permuted ATP-grasp superfamily protein/uncharacterized alpha-E superfamily protein